MSGGAITMMLIGMAIIWGGLALSIRNAVKVARAKKANN
ncbi:methionine/alanine import family NSS transporter small subunit [Desertibacillus haloalkaliphilus]|nr:methionine/alanine import family NSS transporter small subunit [Desertibacillus haloalkaliphilus]MBU8906577.1 methionine/alanine import family NSS transporter small subunit [Desertibacillus haloalkaliphilus]